MRRNLNESKPYFSKCGGVWWCQFKGRIALGESMTDAWKRFVMWHFDVVCP